MDFQISTIVSYINNGRGKVKTNGIPRPFVRTGPDVQMGRRYGYCPVDSCGEGSRCRMEDCFNMSLSISQQCNPNSCGPCSGNGYLDVYSQYLENSSLFLALLWSATNPTTTYVIKCSSERPAPAAFFPGPKNVKWGETPDYSAQ